MANRAYLLAVEDRSATWSDDPEREIIAEGINEIPVFWASLFVPEDSQLDTYESEDDSENAQGISIPNWCVDLNTARQRLAGRREPIGRLLDDRSRAVWFSFVDHLSAEGATYIKTNAAEVWDLDPDGYESYRATLLRLFTEPSAENLNAALKANDLADPRGSVRWDDEEETICKLAGADHIRDVPWLDD